MNQYQVDMEDGHVSFTFECDADNFNHALEQAVNAYPGASVIKTFMVGRLPEDDRINKQPINSETPRLGQTVQVFNCRGIVEEHRYNIKEQDEWGIRLENGNFYWVPSEGVTEVPN